MLMLMLAFRWFVICCCVDVVVGVDGVVGVGVCIHVVVIVCVVV